MPLRAGPRRRAVAFAIGASIGMLAVVPVVLAQAGDGGVVDTVGICHALGGGLYESTQALETDFYGADQQGHGTHGQDIVPSFTIENPGPTDPSSFPGRNLDKAGELLLGRGCVVDPPGPTPPRKVGICHATSSRTNPYISDDPAIANNGDLQGGHLNHKGPVFPAGDWGDIIPPYDYIDSDGKLQTFGGYNWSEDGQRIWENGCELPAPPQPKPVEPELGCVEALDGGQFLAHYGYRNPNPTTVEPPPEQNQFSPGEASRGQPNSFASGRVTDAFQVQWGGSDLTWTLTGNDLTVSSGGSPKCQGSITVVKKLVPADDAGRFDLKIDGKTAGSGTAVGDAGTTGTIAVDSGQRKVSESAAPGTSLDDYLVEINCRDDGGTRQLGAGASDPSMTVQVRRGSAIVCTITNTRRHGPDERNLRPVLECVVFNEGSPDLAVWGYENTTSDPITVPPGEPGNRFTPTPRDRGQPDHFEPGRLVGVFETPFEAGSTTLAWHLSGETGTASASSPRCTATLAVRKIVVPADDPGRFELRLNGAVVASGGNGATSGPLVVGTGEGTVSETAAAGTSLSDYDSRVQCTRNGTVAISVPGTKVDGAIARGDVVMCTFTNTRKGTSPQPEPPQPEPPQPEPPRPTPPPEPEQRLDLVVIKTAKPAVVRVGGRITWTMTVTNNSAVTAADVNGIKVDDPRSFRTKLISLTPSQGTCRPFTCDLGRLAPGASATVVAVTEALEVGTVIDVVRVSSEEIESNYRNNVAAALVRVVGPLRVLGVIATCRTLTVAPPVLEARRTSTVRLEARNRLGRPVAGLVVRAAGAGVRERARTDRQGFARMEMTPSRVGLVLFASGGRRAPASRAAPTCLTVLGVRRARPTQVTG